MTRTPSKKLNDFLKANGKAVGAVLREQAAQAEIPEDRELSPESRAAFDAALATLGKPKTPSMTLQDVGTQGMDRAFQRSFEP